ncbi:MAG: response regulator [Opitutaceae bacterium]|nr:response regulator [Opitutaceae bacterium]
MNSGRDILVIDDEPVVLQGVARICRDEGLSIETAGGGVAGLQRLGQHAYRLILCDIMMEDLDGFGFLAECRRRGCRSPIVLASGYATGENAIRSLQCGAFDYMAKPFTADELLAVIRRALNYSALLAEHLEAWPTIAPRTANIHHLGRVSWATSKPEGTVVIGVDGLFVKTIQGLRSVELAPVGAHLVQGMGCATIVSTDGLAHSVMCPVSGQVLQAHAEAAADFSMIGKDPFGAGWLYRLLPSDLEYSFRCLTSPSDPPDQRPVHQKGVTS